jgi:riboflavin biosynthesis pyrimidine reductase
VIERLLPAPGEADVSDERLLDLYRVPDAPRPWVRFEFVSSADGAASIEGRSGGLGNDGDRRVLQLLRRLPDVLLLGAGTVRAEGYGGELLDEAGRAWRRRRGLPDRPLVAVVSARLDLDPGLPFFTEAPERPLVVTIEAADPERRRALHPVARVLDAGEDALDPVRLRSVLGNEGRHVVHSEGGPTLFGAFARAGAVDDLCLSISPLLVGGGGPRIVAGGPLPAPAGLRLEHVLRAGDLLLLRYSALRG